MKRLAFAIGLTLIAAVLTYGIVISLETGVFQNRMHIARSEQPALFWTMIAFYAFLAYAAAGFAIEMIRKK